MQKGSLQQTGQTGTCYYHPLLALLLAWWAITDNSLAADVDREDRLEWLRVIEFEHNHPKHLAAEIHSLEVQRTIFGVQRAEELPLAVLEARFLVTASEETTSNNRLTNALVEWGQTNSFYGTRFRCSLMWPSSEARQKITRSEKAIITGYLNGRLKGHTKGYMLKVFAERSQSRKETNPHLALIQKQFPDVPVSLITKCDFYVTTEPTEACYQILDGPLAWIYQTDLRNHVAVQDLTDVQEINEATRETVREAGLEAARNLESRGVKRGIGYCHSFWPEKKRILRERFGITWRSPQDLSPWTLFD